MCLSLFIVPSAGVVHAVYLLAQTLLKFTPSLFTVTPGWMPLHEAANYGYDEIVTVLLKNGANVNARGMDGDTPLHDAAVNGHLQVQYTCTWCMYAALTLSE